MAKFQGVLLDTPKIDKNAGLAFELAQSLAINPGAFTRIEEYSYGQGQYVEIEEDNLRIFILNFLRERDASTG